MWRAVPGLVLLLMVAGCQGPETVAQKKPLTAQSVTLQAKDVPSMQRCEASGDLDTVLKREKSSDPKSYESNSYQWGLWKREGATEGYLAVYGASPRDCARNLHGFPPRTCWRIFVRVSRLNSFPVSPPARSKQPPCSKSFFPTSQTN